MSLRCLPSSLDLICTMVWEFQDGPPWRPSWMWEWNKFSILNRHVSQMPPTKFQLNQTYPSRANVFSRFSSWPPWWQSWILEWNQFSNSKSPCYPNCLPPRLGSIKLTVQEQTWFEYFQDGHHGGHVPLSSSDAYHQVSAQSNTVWEEMLFKDFQDG